MIQRLLAEHDAAIGEFIARARAVDPSLWNVPRAPGKWTPAQEATHLSLGYATFVSNLRDGPGFQMRGKAWQRRVWRLFALPGILATGRLIRGVRAPREARPPENPGDQTKVLGELEHMVVEFRTAVAESYAADPGRTVSHPYFTVMTLPELAKFAAVHARHHAGFLP